MGMSRGGDLGSAGNSLARQAKAHRNPICLRAASIWGTKVASRGPRVWEGEENERAEFANLDRLHSQPPETMHVQAPGGLGDCTSLNVAPNSDPCDSHLRLYCGPMNVNHHNSTEPVLSPRRRGWPGCPEGRLACILRLAISTQAGENPIGKSVGVKSCMTSNN